MFLQLLIVYGTELEDEEKGWRIAVTMGRHLFEQLLQVSLISFLSIFADRLQLTSSTRRKVACHSDHKTVHSVLISLPPLSDTTVYVPTFSSDPAKFCTNPRPGTFIENYVQRIIMGDQCCGIFSSSNEN